MVAVTDKRLKAIATVSGLLNAPRRFLANMTAEQAQQVFGFANEARQKAYESEMETGKTQVEYFDGMGFGNVTPENMAEQPLLIQDGYDYYMTERAGVPNFDAKTPTTLMEFGPLACGTAYAPYLYMPYLGIYGSRAMNDNGPLTIEFYEACTEPKKLVEIEGASHVDLYDKAEFVDQAVAEFVKSSHQLSHA